MRRILLALLIMLAPVVYAQSGDGEKSDDWKEFRHSSGATLSLPASWQAIEYPTGIQVQPPDATPTELFVVAGVPTNGTSDPMAEDVANYLDTSLWQMLPGLRRTGPPTEIEAAKGKGALYRYAGSIPDGTAVKCDIYVTIENGVALSLSAIAPPDTLRSRTDTLERLFASVQLGGPANAAAPADGGAAADTDDTRLTGMFAGESLAGGGDTGVYVNTRLVYVLNGDGTLFYGAQSHFNASERDYNGNLKWTATGNSDSSVQSGRWSARGGFLTIRWDSGQQSVFAYGFEPDGSLVLRDPTTRKLINFYSRVR